jgi:hypothetical protein
MAGMFCVESDGAVASAPFRRSSVARMAPSAERFGLTGGVAASGASGLAGCVDGNGRSGAVAHPAKRTATAKSGKIRAMNMDCQC